MNRSEANNRAAKIWGDYHIVFRETRCFTKPGVFWVVHTAGRRHELDNDGHVSCHPLCRVLEQLTTRGA